MAVSVKSGTNFVRNNLGEIGAGAGGAVIGSVLGFIAGRRSSNKTYRRRKKHSSNRARKRNHKRIKGRRYTPHTAGKRKDKSHKRIRYTSRGQPYILLRNGKARFISLRSAKSSHKKKGGRY